MNPSYSLAHLTTEGLTPLQMLDVAAQAGYQYVSIRLLPAAPGGLAYPLMQNRALLRETKARIESTGVGIFDLELIRVDEQFSVEACLPFFEVGGELGAHAILIAAVDANRNRLIDSYAALCEAAYPFGLTGDLEFMPWTSVPDLDAAMDVVSRANPPNGGVLVDALHFDRSNSRVEQLDEIPCHWLHYAQICDGPVDKPDSAEGLIHAARCERWLPGDGGIDLAALWRRLPEDLPVSVEIPHQRRIAEIGYEPWAREALEASQRLIANLHSSQNNR